MAAMIIESSGRVILDTQYVHGPVTIEAVDGVIHITGRESPVTKGVQ